MLPQSKILYIWVPFAFFLLVIFIILAVSFVKHTLRVLKRRRVVMDYLEAEVLSKRPRICRMYSSHVNPEETRYLCSEWSTSYDDHTVINCSSDPKEFSSGEFHHTISNDHSFRTPYRPLRYLRVPNLGNTETFRNKHNGLEDSGQSMWFRDRMIYGYNNLAFSFDEDLGRSHTRRVIPPPRSPVGVLGSHRQEMMTRHGYTPPMAVIDSERESPQSSVCASNRTSSGTRSVTSVVCETHGTGENSDNHVANPHNSPSAKPSRHSDHGHETVRTTADIHPQTCPHCGNILPTQSHTKNTETRSKKRPKYRRQPACSDSTELNPGPDLRLSRQGVQKSDNRPLNSSRPIMSESYESQVNNDRTKINGRSESRSPDVTASITDSRSTVSTPSALGVSNRSSGQTCGTDRTVKGLEVYTIERTRRSSDVPSPWQTERNRQRATTKAGSLRRTASASLPCHDRQLTTPKIMTSTSQTAPRSPQSRRLLLSPEDAYISSSATTTTTAATTTTLLSTFLPTLPSSASVVSSATAATLAPRPDENSIFWLSGNSVDTHQTLV